MQGAQSREFFIEVAAMIGYSITISEYRVWVVGLDRCGDNRVYGDGSNPMLNEWDQPIVNPVGKPVAEGELSAWPNYGLGPPENRFYWTVACRSSEADLVSRHVGSMRRRSAPAHRPR